MASCSITYLRPTDHELRKLVHILVVYGFPEYSRGVEKSVNRSEPATACPGAVT